MQKNLKAYKKLNKEESVWLKLLYLFIFPLILFVITVLPINQGVDVSDTMYSLSSDALFSKAQGNWNLFMAYYLANFAGFLFTKLPFGHTMLGMNFYTSMVVYAAALIVYFYFGKKKLIDYPLLFVGELIAISFCWCPSTVLYNFLSYLLWIIGILQLRSALLSTDSKKRFGSYLGAGLILGASVFVKFPNITVAIMILPVFYYAFLTKEDAAILWKKVLFCILGFVAAFAVLFAFMEIRYGKGTYLSMVESLFSMTDTATDYKATGMLTEIAVYYRQTLPFMLGMILAVLAGIVMLSIAKELDAKKNRNFFVDIGKVLYVVCIPVLFRLFYGRGLFGTDYSDTFAIIFVGTLFLWITLVAAVFTICKKEVPVVEKIDSLMLLLLIFITPLGSNNGVYPMMDNLFLVVPLTLSLISKHLKNVKLEKKFPIYAMLIAYMALMLVQGIRFTGNHSFKGQDEGRNRDTKIENNVILKGMLTNEERAKDLETVLEAADSLLDESTYRYVLTYGDIPGFYFLLENSQPVMTTIWPDLDSFSYENFRIDLAETEGKIIHKGIERPLLILTSEVFEHMNSVEASKKEVLLKEFMETLKYDMMFENERYLIFR